MREGVWRGSSTVAPGLVLRVFVAAILALALGAAAAQELPGARDLQADGREAASQRRIVVLMFSTVGCPYCRKVRQGYLGPMAKTDDRVLVREIEIDRPHPVIDFAGRPTTSAALGKHHSVRFVPTVVFLGPGGERLAEPLVGIASLDLYGGVLERRIETALEALGAQRR